MQKVFCIGFHKTGTNSLEAALEHLGYKVCDHRVELIPFLEKNDFSKVVKIVNAYDGVRDNPWPVIFKELDSLFPGNKFILTIRDEEKWLRSVVNHFNSKPSVMLEYIYGKPFPEGNENIYLARYRKHNEDVLHYFKGRESDLLVLDLSDENPWEKICAFLGKPVPDIPFPEVNKGAYTVFEKLNKNFVRVKKGIMRRLGLLKST